MKLIPEKLYIIGGKINTQIETTQKEKDASEKFNFYSSLAHQQDAVGMALWKTRSDNQPSQKEIIGSFNYAMENNFKPIFTSILDAKNYVSKYYTASTKDKCQQSHIIFEVETYNVEELSIDEIIIKRILYTFGDQSCNVNSSDIINAVKLLHDPNYNDSSRLCNLL